MCIMAGFDRVGCYDGSVTEQMLEMVRGSIRSLEMILKHHQDWVSFMQHMQQTGYLAVVYQLYCLFLYLSRC